MMRDTERLTSMALALVILVGLLVLSGMIAARADGAVCNCGATGVCVCPAGDCQCPACPAKRLRSSHPGGDLHRFVYGETALVTPRYVYRAPAAGCYWNGRKWVCNTRKGK